MDNARLKSALEGTTHCADRVLNFRQLLIETGRTV